LKYQLPGYFISRLALLLILVPGGINGITVIDQPRYFNSLSEWYFNLYKRVSDCIGDTLPVTGDSESIARAKTWAAPLCNQILFTLNRNLNKLNGNQNDDVRDVINQEYLWKNIAQDLYGPLFKTRQCGLGTILVADCAFVESVTSQTNG